MTALSLNTALQYSRATSFADFFSFLLSWCRLLPFDLPPSAPLLPQIRFAFLLLLLLLCPPHFPVRPRCCLRDSVFSSSFFSLQRAHLNPHLPPLPPPPPVFCNSALCYCASRVGVSVLGPHPTSFRPSPAASSLPLPPNYLTTPDPPHRLPSSSSLHVNARTTPPYTVRAPHQRIRRISVHSPSPFSSSSVTAPLPAVDSTLGEPTFRSPTSLPAIAASLAWSLPFPSVCVCAFVCVCVRVASSEDVCGGAQLHFSFICLSACRVALRGVFCLSTVAYLRAIHYRDGACETAVCLPPR